MISSLASAKGKVLFSSHRTQSLTSPHTLRFSTHRAVAHTSASLPALFSCLSPFLTGFLAYIFLGERMGSASDIIGLLLNVSGLLAVIYSKMRLEGPMPVIAAAPETDAVDQDHADVTTGPLTEAPAATAGPAPAKGSLGLSRPGTLKTVPEEASSRPATPAAS